MINQYPVLKQRIGAEWLNVQKAAVSLEDYLGFRHVVRNLYTWDLDPAKVNRLVEQLPQLISALDADLEEFGRFLEAAGRADES